MRAGKRARPALSAQTKGGSVAGPEPRLRCDRRAAEVTGVITVLTEIEIVWNAEPSVIRSEQDLVP